MFSKYLKEFLSLSQLKTTHLANYLGYDFSYISKWISESRLPSIKNNKQLFDNISQFFIDNASEEGLKAIKTIVEKEIQTKSDLNIKLSDFLQYCYNQQKMQKKKITVYNSYLEFNNSDNIIDLIKTNSNELWIEKEKSVEFISTIHIDNYFYDFDCIRLLKWFVSKGKRIHLVQVINNDSKKGSLNICRLICELLNISEYIDFSVIECDYDVKQSGFVIINKKTAILEFENSFFDQSIWAFTKEESIVKHLYTVVETQKIKEISIFDKLEMSTENVLDYFAEPNARYILTSMQPLYMEMNVLNGKSKDITTNELIYHVGIKTSKKVIILKSTIIDYFTNHQIELYGKDINLDQNECSKHLKYIAKKFHDIGESELFILNDINPVFNYDFDNFNFYMNDNSLHITRKSGDKVIASINMTYKPIVSSFNKLFNCYIELSSEYCLSGIESIDYIENLAMLLE